jgi:hypothetical protein
LRWDTIGDECGMSAKSAYRRGTELRDAGHLAIATIRGGSRADPSARGCLFTPDLKDPQSDKTGSQSDNLSHIEDFDAVSIGQPGSHIEDSQSDSHGVLLRNSRHSQSDKIGSQSDKFSSQSDKKRSQSDSTVAEHKNSFNSINSLNSSAAADSNVVRLANHEGQCVRDSLGEVGSNPNWRPGQRALGVVPEGWERFRDTYPKQANIGDALPAYEAAIASGVHAETLFRAAKDYRESFGTEANPVRFAKPAKAWLENRMWLEPHKQQQRRHIYV